MLAVSYYDEQRRDSGMVTMGPYRGTRSWRTDSRLLRVPPNAREAIVRIGLFGATGQVDFNDIQIEKNRKVETPVRVVFVVEFCPGCLIEPPVSLS